MINPYIEVPFIVWAVAQLTKFCLAAANGRLDFKYLYASGGMPSVHSATVVSLAVTALLVDGVESPIFGFSAVFAAIVMYDSFGVRRASGEQAAAINVILSSLVKDKIGLSTPQRPLREILGHKPLEVTMGAILGLILGGLLNFSHLGPVWDVLGYEVPQIVTYITIGTGVLAILAAAYNFVFVRRRYKGIPSGIRSAVWAGWTSLALGFVAIAVGLLELADAPYANYAIWPALIVIVFGALRAGIWLHFAAPVKAEIAQRDTKEAVTKWLEPLNKKKAKAKAKKR